MKNKRKKKRQKKEKTECGAVPIKKALLYVCMEGTTPLFPFRARADRAVSMGTPTPNIMPCLSLPEPGKTVELCVSVYILFLSILRYMESKSAATY